MRFFKLNDDPPPCARAPACTRMCVPAHIREDLLKQINLLMAKTPSGDVNHQQIDLMAHFNQICSCF